MSAVRTPGVAPVTAPTQDRGRVHRSGGVAVPITMVFLIAISAYFLLPVVWLVFASTKDTADLAGSFGLWFADLHLMENLRDLFTQDGAVFGRWLANSALYAGVGAVGGTLLAAMAGFALAKYQFRGREALFAIVLGGVLIPQTVLALPLFLLLSNLQLVNSYWAVLLPSLVSPFGVYMCRVYAAAVPDELLEAGRLDGAGELRIFFSVVMRIMTPALVTVLLFQFVGIWNNFFLPLVVLKDIDLFPVTLGLFTWNAQVIRAPDLVRLVVTGSLVSVIPLVITFFVLQRYWRAGLTAGAVK